MLRVSQFCSAFPRTEVRAAGLCQGPAQQPETSAGVGALGAWDDVKLLVHLPNAPNLESQPRGSPGAPLLPKRCSQNQWEPCARSPVVPSAPSLRLLRDSEDTEPPLCHLQRALNGTGGAGVGHRLCQIAGMHAQLTCPGWQAALLFPYSQLLSPQTPWSQSRGTERARLSPPAGPSVPGFL